MSHNKGITPDRETIEYDYSDASLPSYNEATRSNSRSNLGSRELPGFVTTRESIEQLLRSLPLQVQNARQDQLSQQQEDERLLIEKVTPYIADFIRNLPRSILYPQKRKHPLSAELILFPAGAVPAEQGWVLSGLHERKQQAAHFRLEEVTSTDKVKLDSLDQKRADTFEAVPGDDWKGPLWWDDEDLADRLASSIGSYLHPKKASEPESCTRADEGNGNMRGNEINEGASRHGESASRHKPYRSFFFGRYKQSHASTGHKEAGSQTLVGGSTGNTQHSSEVVKTVVRSEEVTFRRENDMGLWESASGWAITLTVTVAL
ncbi:hypothetical protein VPNG_08634 [Cytospora leucostoma]|uniref:Uncharacterized protein n=1 Tax=Cytospora leucostoma TaxID=1230097 RepID=A0A423W385_9PEZI|nr:hypothetical protein VPNG_08634 [Cytospora leucostoma]